MDERKAVIKAEHIKKYFPVKGVVGKKKAVVKAVDDVSLTVYEGETVGLVGETGCGKSTFGRTILKLTEPTDGKIYLDGEDITGYSERKLRKYRQKMQIVFQDPYSSLDPRETIGKSLEEVLQIQGRKQGCREKVLETLELVGLSSEVYDRYPHEFSGSSLSTALQSITIFNSFFKIKSNHIRVLLPLPSLNGCAIFISTYFSTISSNVDCGIFSIFSRAACKYITDANLKLPFAIFTVRTFPAKSYISSNKYLWIATSILNVPAS